MTVKYQNPLRISREQFLMAMIRCGEGEESALNYWRSMQTEAAKAVKAATKKPIKRVRKTA